MQLRVYRVGSIPVQEDKAKQSPSSGVNGRQGENLSPDAAFWGGQTEVGIVHKNMKCQRILIITIYKMPNASDCCPIAKSYQDQQGPQIGLGSSK